MTHDVLVVDLLPDQLEFTEGVPRLPSDGVYRALVHLLLDRAVQHKQRLAGALAQELK